MSAPSPRTFVYAVLLPHPTEHRVLVQRDGDGWVLPHWKTTERHFWAAADYVNRTGRGRLGAELRPPPCLPHDPDPADGPIRRTYDLENHSPHWQPPADARWAGLDDLERLRLIIPGDRAARARGRRPAAPRAGAAPRRCWPWVFSTGGCPCWPGRSSLCSLTSSQRDGRRAAPSTTPSWRRWSAARRGCARWAPPSPPARSRRRRSTG